MNDLKDWIDWVDDILQLNDREILTHASKISHQIAMGKSKEKHEKFKLIQKANGKEVSLKELEADIKKLKKS